MKQRLLFTLLALFVSIGLVKADIVFKVPKNNGTVTVQISGSGVGTGAISGSPNLSNSGNTYTITKPTSEGSYTISNSALSSATNVTITFSVKDDATVTSITGNGIATITQITANKVGLTECSLDLSGLKTLNVSDNELASIDLGSSNNLTSLNVSNNKLKGITLPDGLEEKNLTINVSGNRIPWFTGSEDCKSVTWGKQTVDAPASSSVSTTVKANVGFDMQKLAQEYSLKELLNDNNNLPSGVTYRWYKKSSSEYATSTTNEARAWNKTYPYQFKFYDNSNVYVAGTYKCEMTLSGKTFVIEDLVVEAAELDLTLKKNAFGTISATPKGGSVISSTTSDDGTGKVKQSQILDIAASPVAGYEFVEFVVSGFGNEDSKEHKTTPVQLTVVGKWDATTNKDVNPVIEAKFAPVKNEISFKQVEHGSFTVSRKDGDKTAPVNSGDGVDYNSTIIVKITPDPGYEASLAINGNKVELTNNEYTFVTEDKDYELTVNYTPNDEIELTASIDGSITGCNYITNGVITYALSETTVSSTDQFEATLPAGEQCQMSFGIDQTTDGNEHRVLDEILLNGTKLVPTKTDGEKGPNYTVSFTIPLEKTTILIKTKTLTTLSVKADVDANNTQVYFYDDKPKTFEIKTTPSGYEDKLVIKYKSISLGNQYYGTNPPESAGTYDVSVDWMGDDNYDAWTGTAYYRLKIEKINPNITTLPKVEVKDGKYVITGGEAKIGTNGDKVTGVFEVLDNSNPAQTTENLLASGKDEEGKAKSHTVKVQFTAEENGTENTNFYKSTATVDVIVDNKAIDKYSVSIVDKNKLPEGVSVEIYNGNQLVKSGDKFATGTELTLLVYYPEGSTGIAVKETKTGATSSYEGTTVIPNTKPIDITVGTENAEYTVTIDNEVSLTKEYTVSLEKQTKTYNKLVQTYQTSGINVEDADGKEVTGTELTNLISKMVITYKNGNNTYPEAINAASYTVCVMIPADPETGYKEQKLEFSNRFIIEQDVPTVTTWPTATILAKGQSLKQSDLVGGVVDVEGMFEWEDNTIVPASATTKQVAVFKPKDATNYKEVKTPFGTGTTDERIEVTVSDRQIVTFAQVNGKVEVTDSKGNKYETGNTVSEGTVLKITTTPNEGFELTSLLVNGQSNSGSYTVGESSVAIDATFELKPANPETVVITVNASTGVVPSKVGAQSVAFNSNLTFTVATLEADKDKVTVTADGAKITPNSSGVYSVKADKAKTVSVSVSNPTAITVKADTTLSPGKKPMGTVEIQGWTSTKKYYYGDEIIVTAFPESGATFTGWQGLTSKENPLEITLTEPSYTFKAQYSGTLVGIEDVETVKYYGADGYIYVNCPTKATLIVISMNGRSQRLQVSGQTRVTVAAGIYGIVLDMDGEVIRDKVVVR